MVMQRLALVLPVWPMIFMPVPSLLICPHCSVRAVVPSFYGMCRSISYRQPAASAAASDSVVSCTQALALGAVLVIVGLQVPACFVALFMVRRCCSRCARADSVLAGRLEACRAAGARLSSAPLARRTGLSHATSAVQFLRDCFTSRGRSWKLPEHPGGGIARAWPRHCL